MVDVTSDEDDCFSDDRTWTVTLLCMMPSTRNARTSLSSSWNMGLTLLS